MKSQNKVWTDKDLILAYYMAKWNMNGISIDEDSLVHGVIGDTSVGSFRMQVANFRYLLNIEGHQLQHASKKMKELCKELENKTMTQVRKIAMQYIMESETGVKYFEVQKNNERAYKSRDILNKMQEAIFQNKLTFLSRGRRLVPKH